MPRYKPFGKTSRKKVNNIRHAEKRKQLKIDAAVENPNINVNNSELHKCTQCEKEFKTFEDIKIHFLETHTKWKKNDSSVEERQNVSIEKESTSSETKASNELTPTINKKEDSNSTHHNLGQETFFSKPMSKSKTHKVEIVFECDSKNCGKRFKNFGDLEIHKKTQHVDISSKRCTKCDAEFESFEILKHHFLQTHTNWRKEDESNKSKDDEDVIIAKENGEDPNNDIMKEKIIKNYAKIILNSMKVDRRLQVNTITTDPNVQGYLTLNTVESIKEKQPVSNINDAVIDDPKNTFIIFSENASNNTAFYIVKTKPNINNSTSNIQDDLLCRLLSNNKDSYVAKNINDASCFSSFPEYITSDPKTTADFCQNFRTDLRNSKTNTPIVKPTPKVVYNMPYERNTTSSVSNETPVAKYIILDEPMDTPVEIKNTSSDVVNTMPEVKTSSVSNETPVAKDIILDEPMDTPVEIKNTSSDVVNTMPEVKSITSDVANTVPNVGKITSMIEKILPVLRNVKSVPTVKTAVKKSRQIRKVSNKRCYCFNCLSGTNDGFNKVMIHMCSDCGQEFIKKFEYHTHIRKHDPFMIYHCPLSCGERFNRPDKIFNHVHLHNQWKNICQICKKGFESVTQLERHSQTYHNRKPLEIVIFGSNNNEISDDINLEVQLTNGNTEIANQASSSLSGLSTDKRPLLDQGLLHGPPLALVLRRLNPAAPCGSFDVAPPSGGTANTLYSEHGSYKKKQAFPKEKDTAEIINDISEEEDNDANHITEISDEDDSSSEESTVDDITNVPGLVEDEVCLELGENFVNNTPPDPLSVFEEIPKSQIILNREESVGAIHEGITNLKEENMEFDLSIQTEQSIKPVPLNDIVNIREESVEYMSLVKIKRENEMRQMNSMEERTEPFSNQNLNEEYSRLNEENMEFDFSIQTEQSIKPVPLNDIVNIGEESVEYMSLVKIKRENEMRQMNSMEKRTEPFSNQNLNEEYSRLNEENMEFDLSIQTEQSIKPVPLNDIVNIGEESVEYMSLVKIKRENEMRQMNSMEKRTEPFSNQNLNEEYSRLNEENMEFDLSIQTEQSIKPVLLNHIVNIGEESVDGISLVKIKRKNEMRQMKTMEERTESFPNQIVNIDKENNMEHTPLARVKREVECIESVPEQMINTEESVEFIPTETIKREIESINLVPGHKIHVADANLVMQSLNGNRHLRVDLERLPF